MINKRVIIIDDKDQSPIIEQLIAKARQKGFNLSCIQFKPNVTAFRKQITKQDGTIDFVLDMVKLIAAIDTPSYLKQEVNLIACDYNLEDENITGLEFSLKIREIRKNMPILFYSAENDLFEKKLYGLKKIKQLIKIKFEDFIDRNQYPDSILKLLETPLSLENQFTSMLQSYNMLKFHRGFPKAEGMTLQEVLDEVNRGTTLGDEFSSEMIQLTVANIIQISYE